MSPLQKERIRFKPEIPKTLQTLDSVVLQESETVIVDPKVRKHFTHLQENKMLTAISGQTYEKKALKVGVVLSGGQASGGHNVITGLFDALQEIHPESELIGFLNGPKGLMQNAYKLLDADFLSSYRNQGGFDCIGSGRDKIQKPEEFEMASKTAIEHDLDGLVIIGGDDSNTNACFLAEYFLEKKMKTSVVGVPKTIDGDLQSDAIEVSFGFDTACKVYSETISNIARDALSNKKYYYFIKLMGRSASHVTLECALKTKPNLTFIAEEVEQKKMSLSDIVDEVVSLIKKRKQAGKEYGVILIPEGLIEFIPEMQALIQYLNHFLAEHEESLSLLEKADKIDFVSKHLPEAHKKSFEALPQEIQLQLLLDRDPHGNVQVSKIETERLLIELASKKCQFSHQAIFCGYEGRSCLPSNFDANYCYSLGRLASLLLFQNKTGYIVSLKNLTQEVQNWQPVATPLVSMLHPEMRKGVEKLVIQKTLVDLEKAPFQTYLKQKDANAVDDCYVQTGPIQFFGPSELTDSVPESLLLARGSL